MLSKLEQELKLRLPPELQEKALLLAQLLSVLTFPTNSTRDGVINIEDPSILDVIRVLAGSTIAVESSVIRFGENNQVGDISIRDVANGNIYNYNISMHFPNDIKKRYDENDFEDLRDEDPEYFTNNGQPANFSMFDWIDIDNLSPDDEKSVITMLSIVAIFLIGGMFIYWDWVTSIQLTIYPNLNGLIITSAFLLGLGVAFLLPGIIYKRAFKTNMVIWRLSGIIWLSIVGFAIIAVIVNYLIAWFTSWLFQK